MTSHFCTHPVSKFTVHDSKSFKSSPGIHSRFFCSVICVCYQNPSTFIMNRLLIVVIFCLGYVHPNFLLAAYHICFFGHGEESSLVAGFLVNNGTGNPLPGAAMNAAFAAGITSPGGDMGSLDSAAMLKKNTSWYCWCMEYLPIFDIYINNI